MKFTFRPIAAVAVAVSAMISTLTVAPAMAQTTPTEEAVRKVMMEHPEWIAEALEKLQQRAQEAQSASLLATARPVAERIIAGDTKIPTIGNAAGSKQLVEFFDYNCGFCKRFEKETLEPLIAKDSQVQFHMVFTTILGPGSERMAEFAAAAQLQNKFTDAHEFLIQKSAQSVEAANALKPELIAAANLDEAAFEKALSNGSAKAIVDHHNELSREAGVSGTPMIYANDRVAPGAIPIDALEQLLNS